MQHTVHTVTSVCYQWIFCQAANCALMVGFMYMMRSLSFSVLITVVPWVWSGLRSERGHQVSCHTDYKAAQWGQRNLTTSTLNDNSVNVVCVCVFIPDPENMTSSDNLSPLRHFLSSCLPLMPDASMGFAGFTFTVVSSDRGTVSTTPELLNLTIMRSSQIDRRQLSYPTNTAGFDCEWDRKRHQ